MAVRESAGFVHCRVSSSRGTTHGVGADVLVPPPNSVELREAPWKGSCLAARPWRPPLIGSLRARHRRVLAPRQVGLAGLPKDI